jgi:hypothetical protein
MVWVGTSGTKKKKKKQTKKNHSVVAHTCVLANSGGKDQEDRGLKPAQGNSWQDPISKNPSQKKGWWSGSRCRL